MNNHRLRSLKKLGGKVEIESAPGKGSKTTVSIRLASNVSRPN